MKNRGKRRQRKSLVAALLTFTMMVSILFTARPVRAAETWQQYLARQWAACEAEFAALNKETGLPQWNGSAAEAVDGDGDGLVEVTTPEQFYWALTNAKSLKLMNDIDLGGTAGRLWTPVNVTGTNPMIVDGNGHTVYNLKVSAPATAGLFATVNNPAFVMKNLNFRYAEIRRSAVVDGNMNYAVAIANFVRGVMEDVGVEDSLVQGNRFAAGLTVGWNTSRVAFDGTNVYTDMNNNLGTIINRCHTARVYTYGTWCIGNFAAPLMGSRVTNSYAVDGVSVSTAGHSGGFISCPGWNYVENCFCNITMYGQSDTAVFSGVAHYSNKYVHCYASGVVEGESNVGGFVGDGSAAENSNHHNYYDNCYSTTMVGMQNQASNMGGFVGYNDGYLHMTDCYSAGEVGALTTDPGVAGSVGGFGGVITPTCTNCYYDKQTSAMRERVVGNSTQRDDIKGKQTADLLGQLPEGFEGGVWSAQEGLYPQLKVFCDDAMLAANFSEKDRAIVKAYSAASACTAMLYPSNNSDYTDEINYDTVRSIQYLFPLTNNAMVNNPQYDISWEADDIKSSVTGMEDLQVITLDKKTYAVVSLAPGIGWTTVKVRYYPNPADKSNYVVGTRRLRLVPTTTLSVATSDGVNHLIYAVPGEGARPLADTYTRYDHRVGVFFSKGNATQLNNGQLTSSPFPADNPDFENVNLSAVGGYVDVSVEKKNGEDWESIPLTDSLKKLLLYERDANREDLGVYRLTYSWYSSGAAAGGAHLQSVKYLTVCNAFKVTYMRNDGTDKIHHTDPGAYVDGDSVGTYLPKDPVRVGYTFAGWYTEDKEENKKDFDKDTPLHGDTVVYARWKADKHTVVFKLDKDSTDIYGKEIQETGETVKWPEDPKRPGYSFVGWSTDPRGDEPDYDPDEPLLDKDLTFYAVWKKNPAPEFTKQVVNQSASGEGVVRVQDVLRYTLTAANKEADSEWVNVKIQDTIPAGLTLIKDSIRLQKADGSEEQLDAADVYNEAERRLEVPLGTVKGGEGYVVIFDAFVNGETIDEKTPGSHDITNVASAVGSNPDGSGSDVTSEPVLPDGGDDIQVGNPSPKIEKSVSNGSRGDQSPAEPGDVLTYTVTVSNPAAGTLWKNVTVKDTLPKGMKIIKDSIYLQGPDGSRKRLEASETYVDKERTLEVLIGDIAGEGIYRLTFDVELEKGIEKQDIGNAAMAGGQKPDGTQTGWSNTEKVYPKGWDKTGKIEGSGGESPNGGDGNNSSGRNLKGKNPKTGDDSKPVQWAAAMVISLFGMCGVFVIYKKRQIKEQKGKAE